MASVSDNLTITSVQARKAMLKAFKAKRPLFLWGPPGIGKSEVVAEVDIYYAYVWYNSGIGTITDGSGFTGANTQAVNFLRGYSVTSSVIPGVTNALTTEDAINTLTTETDDEIYTED